MKLESYFHLGTLTGLALVTVFFSSHPELLAPRADTTMFSIGDTVWDPSCNANQEITAIRVDFGVDAVGVTEPVTKIWRAVLKQWDGTFDHIPDGNGGTISVPSLCVIGKTGWSGDGVAFDPVDFDPPGKSIIPFNLCRETDCEHFLLQLETKTIDRSTNPATQGVPTVEDQVAVEICCTGPDAFEIHDIEVSEIGTF